MNERQLLDKLGLGRQRVTSLDIRCLPGRPPVVRSEIVADNIDLENLFDDLEGVSGSIRYDLVIVHPSSTFGDRIRVQAIERRRRSDQFRGVDGEGI